MRNTTIPHKKQTRRSLVESVELELWFLGLVVIGVNFGIFWKHQATPALSTAFGGLPNTSSYLLLTVLGLTVFACLLLLAAVIVLLVKMKRVKDRLNRLEAPADAITEIHFYEAADAGEPDPDAEPEKENAPA